MPTHTMHLRVSNRRAEKGGDCIYDQFTVGYRTDHL